MGADFRQPRRLDLREPPSIWFASWRSWGASTLGHGHLDRVYSNCQSDAIPVKQHIQFSQVIAGPNPIDPSLSQESSHQLEFSTQQNRELWVLEFSDTVTRCHAPAGMEYPEASVKYGKYLKRPPVPITPIIPIQPPDTVLALLTGNTHPADMIEGQEKALLFKWASVVPDLYGVLIIELVNGTNELESHLPATVSDLNI
jgi:hypothetical protein